MNVRPPAVAGQFYPGGEEELRATVQRHLEEGRARATGSPPKALVVPHAGYVYSGPIAGSGYALLETMSDTVRRVVLLGPAHFVAVPGMVLPDADAFATPLGEVPIDKEAEEQIGSLAQVSTVRAAHAREHSLEVQLPFLQEVLDEFSLVALAVGDAEPEQVAEVLEVLWGGEETAIVISSDLSHYHDYESARRMDSDTARAIEDLRPEGLGHDSACGRLPVKGLLVQAERHGLTARTVDLRTSGDTAGPRDQVVGYGAFAFS